MKNVLIVTLMVFFTSIGVANACSCALMSAEDVLKNSDALILGSAIHDSEAITRTEGSDDWIGENAMLTNFKVIRDYKNSGDTKLNVVTPVNLGANCGIDFKAKDGILLISAHINEVTGELISSSCGVRWINDASDYDLMIELEELAKQ